EHRRWWSYVSHFTHSPFYVYAYAFGELVALSLYARREEAGFADRYLELLSLGGSRSPEELMATVGVRLDDEAFWRGGMAEVEKLITRFEELAKTA
ncbi:MAG: oligoendopeptidase F, partial [Armatimonadota bacterium]